MSDASDSMDLSGKLLIAMPGMPDPRFERSVIFLCAHSRDGAMGLIVNKPARDLTFAELLEQLEIELEEDPQSSTRSAAPVHFGGPVESGRGFVLHTADYAANSSTLRVNDHFGMTATLDILDDMARGKGPARALLALGYAGWGPGQLEAELVANGWLTCEAAPDLVFGSDNGAKWGESLRLLGVDPLTLSASAGRA